MKNNQKQEIINKLTIKLISSTVWFSSIFQICKKTNQLEKWKEIKEKLFRVEGKKCWICGAENTRLEAHEFWEYDDKNHIQKLVAIHHLCSMCHKIKHIGLWCYTDFGMLLSIKIPHFWEKSFPFSGNFILPMTFWNNAT